MFLEDLATARTLQAEFYEPVRMRRWCAEQEQDYRHITIDSTQIRSTSQGAIVDIKGGVLPLDASQLARADELTGFAKVMRELEKRGPSPKRRLGGASLPSRAQLRAQYHQDRPTKLRLLTKESTRQIVGLTDAAHMLVLPTQVAMWASLLHERLGLRAERQILSRHTHAANVSLEVHLRLLPPDLVDLAPGVGDPAQFAVGIDYEPGSCPSVSVTEDMVRVACENYSLLRETTGSATMAPNHDLGSIRKRFERQVTGALDGMRGFEALVRQLVDRPARDLRGVDAWLTRRHVPLPTRRAILEELGESEGPVTEYDVFNAITAARRRLDRYTPADEARLGRLAGEYLDSVQGGKTRSWIPAALEGRL